MAERITYDGKDGVFFRMDEVKEITILLTMALHRQNRFVIELSEKG